MTSAAFVSAPLFSSHHHYDQLQHLHHPLPLPIQSHPTTSSSSSSSRLSPSASTTTSSRSGPTSKSRTTTTTTTETHRRRSSHHDAVAIHNHDDINPSSHRRRHSRYDDAVQCAALPQRPSPPIAAPAYNDATTHLPLLTAEQSLLLTTAATNSTTTTTTIPSSHPPAILPADKVDSRSKTTVQSVKSRASRAVASFGRPRFRAIVYGHEHTTTQGEALPVRPPVSPSDASSYHKHSGFSSSNKSKYSSDTSLSSDDKTSPEHSPAADHHHHQESYLGSPEGWHDRPTDYYQDTAAYEKYLDQSAQRAMHQTSSKLLRMTEDERPFTRDFKDLFSTLIVSLPLSGHRVRLSRVDHTFTTDEALTNLGSLKFSQSNRMPDPKDSSRIVTTTTTTTFSMAKEMARSVLMKFLEARFVESLEGKTDFNTRSSVWQLSPKGMHILARFCQRNGIHQKHVNDVLESPRNVMQLVILERDPDSDKIYHDPATVNVIFRRFAGLTGPNIKTSSSNDVDTFSDYQTGYVGVRMQRMRRPERETPLVFTGKSAYDWILDCCTVVDKREVFEIANLFLENNLIVPAGDDRHSGHVPPKSSRFTASKHMLYSITPSGMRVAGWIATPDESMLDDGAQRAGIFRDSNTNRLQTIIKDSALRSQFREYLRETHCEENLHFYQDVGDFLVAYAEAKLKIGVVKQEYIRETLASAYGLYNGFLAPGSPCELNIDHNLRNALASRMTRSVGEDEEMVRSLDEVAALFYQAQCSVFKLMASDSVPKFFRETKYQDTLRERNLDHMLAAYATANGLVRA